MPLVSDSSSQSASSAEEHTQEDEEPGLGRAFDMVSLKVHLPQKRKGLSMFFAGKSQSFSCVGDAKCVGDLEKPAPEVPEAKRRKYMERQGARALDLVAWRAAPGASHCGACVGV